MEFLPLCLGVLLFLSVEPFPYDIDQQLKVPQAQADALLLAQSPGMAIAVGEPNPSRKSITVRCHETTMEILINAVLYFAGAHVGGSDLRLGPDSRSQACFATPSGHDSFVIVAPLTDCGTKLLFRDDSLVYGNSLVYTPSPNKDGIIRLGGAVIPIECHYRRRYVVSSHSLKPTFIPFIATRAAENYLDFSLTLMADDWRGPRSSAHYFLGDQMNFEAAVVMAKHMPLRVYVDHCIATLGPELPEGPEYAFINNYGCLVDAKVTGSSAQFLTRVKDDKLRFQLKTFQFYQRVNNLIYITCLLKAVPVSAAGHRTSKACSFVGGRWTSADGNDQVCESCNTPVKPGTPLRDRLGAYTKYGGVWKREITNASSRTSERALSAEWLKSTSLEPFAVLSESQTSTSPPVTQALTSPSPVVPH